MAERANSLQQAENPEKDQVAEVLADDKILQVPLQPEMVILEQSF